MAAPSAQEDFIRTIRAPETRPKPDLLTQYFNDVGNAERLIALYGADLRYCHAMKKWLHWDGRRWDRDESGQARDLATRTMIEFFLQAKTGKHGEAGKFAQKSLDDRAITRLLHLAEHQIAIKPEQLDLDPYRLNFLNGTVDLRTGKRGPHRREDYITRLVHHDYNPDADCSGWLGFLHEIMNRNAEMVAYLQRAIGYSLTGDTGEKAVFVPFGTGNNGKSTFLAVVQGLIQEYSAVIQADSLMTRAGQSNNADADLADLRGARFAMTSETEEGQRLSQSKLKRITQGIGNIRAVRKYENPISFPETHKLWIDTNRRPSIRDADDQATFSRLHPIPFSVVIPKDRVDIHFSEKLLAEHEGILAWAVQGAMDWYAGGLQRPQEIEQAREQWHNEEDQLGRFLEECCITDDRLTVSASQLCAAYKDWSGDKTVNPTSFGLKLKTRGFQKTHVRTGTRYLGIAIRTDQAEPPGAAA